MVGLHEVGQVVVGWSRMILVEVAWDDVVKSDIMRNGNRGSGGLG